MAIVDKKRLGDGFLELAGGVDSSKTPNLILKNQVSFAINTAFRGGWPTCRPGYSKKLLVFDDGVEDAFKAALFQTAGSYQYFDGRGALISMHSGRQFKINIDDFSVNDITVTSDPNNPLLPIADWCQAENFFIIQDGQSKPFIFNGASSRRAGVREVPVGEHITYYNNRIWVSRGREYVAGDILFGPSGTALLGYRDAILKFTENTYIAEGGAFGVPAQAGNITGMKPIANINTALGQAELVVFTESMAFATSVPTDRTQWQSTQQPLQRIIQLSAGTKSSASVVNINEDLFYRSPIGITSLAYAVRNSGQWGNHPISGEVTRILSEDTDSLLPYVSAVNFNNRYLCTASPGIVRERGTYFRCLAVMDFEPLTSMRQQEPPAWDGIWTGLRFLKVLTVQHRGVDRCFAYVLNADDEIELWEISKAERFDNAGEGDVRITWSQESRSMNFANPFDMKQLETGDIFVDRVAGEVDFDMDFRPDSHPCWVDWDSWNECGKYNMCADEFGTCVTLPNFKEQYRPKRQLIKPPDTFDPTRNEKYRTFYELQTRLTVTGFCRLKQCRYGAYIVEEPPYGKQL